MSQTRFFSTSSKVTMGELVEARDESKCLSSYYKAAAEVAQLEIYKQAGDKKELPNQYNKVEKAMEKVKFRC